MPLNRKVLPICFLLSFQGYAPLKETRIPSPLPWDFWEVEKRMRFPAHIIGSSPRPNTSYLTRRASPAQAPVAQLVEQLLCKELVPGSNPGGGYCNSIISGGGFCRNHAPYGLKEMQGRRRLRDCWIAIGIYHQWQMWRVAPSVLVRFQVFRLPCQRLIWLNPLPPTGG